MLDKNLRLVTNSDKPLILELGCGSSKRIAESVGIDILDFPCVDVVGDIMEVLSSIETSSVDEVYSWHFIEHISNVPALLNELVRVSKDGGKIHFTAPHFSNPYFYSDPTHAKYYGLYTFCFYANSKLFSREVPEYSLIEGLNLDEVNLIFKSSRPFYFRYLIKKTIQLIFNNSIYMKELYEEFFCWALPCYEISYNLSVQKHPYKN